MRWNYLYISLPLPSIAMIRSRDLYNSVSEVDNTLTLQELEQLVQGRQDRWLRLQFFYCPLESFWLEISNEFAYLAYRVVSTMLSFPTSFLCETSISTMAATNVKKRENLKAVENVLRVCFCQFLSDFHINAPRSRLKHHTKNNWKRIKTVTSLLCFYIIT